MSELSNSGKDEIRRAIDLGDVGGGEVDDPLIIGAVEATDYLSVGASPAATGAIRLARSGTLKARNEAGDADITLLDLDAFNQLGVMHMAGETLPRFQFMPDLGNGGGGIIWTTGEDELDSDEGWQYYEGPGHPDPDTDDPETNGLRHAMAAIGVTWFGTEVYLYGAMLHSSGGIKLYDGVGITFYDGGSLTSFPGTLGVVRMPYGEQISWRNSTNDGNITIGTGGGGAPDQLGLGGSGNNPWAFLDGSPAFFPDNDGVGTLGKAAQTWGGIFATLPTADPVVAGQFWSDAGTVKVSAGA